MYALFDRYVMFDWSAASTPTTGANSIWCADLRAGGELELTNPPTRHAAAGYLTDVVNQARLAGERVLVGVDASLGVPAATTAMFDLDGNPPWRAWWSYLADRMVDGADNMNNRFDVAADLNRRARLCGIADGPFWVAGNRLAKVALPTRKPTSIGSTAQDAVAEYRHAELVLRRSGLYPKSLWQLTGPGSVGSQALTAVAVLEQLRRRCGSTVAVWPFEVGGRMSMAELPATGVVLAEVWPRLVESRGKTNPTIDVAVAERDVSRAVSASFAADVPDAAQVARLALWMRHIDATTGLSDLMDVPIGARGGAVVDEEGWVLGLPPKV